MTRLLRTSNVDSINELRKILWESVYSNFVHMNQLVKIISGNFYPFSVDLEFNFSDMTFTINTVNRPFDIKELNSCLNATFKEFADYLFSNNIISMDLYDDYKRNINTLYFVTLMNSNRVAKVGL